MCCYLRSITPDRLQELIRSPDQVTAVLPYSDDRPPDPDDWVDLDKSWAGIHFLLTGEEYDGEPPLCDVVLGGEPIGPDGGYGPARFLTPAEVTDVAEAVAAVGAGDLKQRYGDGGSLTEANIYPQIWDRGPADEGLEYVLGYYAEVVRFYRRAADRGYAVVQFIT